MKGSETARVLASIAANYPTFPVTEDRQAIWHECLKDLDYVAVQQAVVRHLSESKFQPTVAEIRRRAVSDPELPTSEQAWGAVLAAIRGGYIDKPRWDVVLEKGGPTAVRVAQSFGWRELYMSDAYDGVTRGQFVRCYREAAENAERQRLLPPALRAPALPSGQRGELESIGEIGVGDE